MDFHLFDCPCCHLCRLHLFNLKSSFFDGSFVGSEATMPFVGSEAAMPFVGVLNNKKEINKDEWT